MRWIQTSKEDRDHIDWRGWGEEEDEVEVDEIAFSLQSGVLRKTNWCPLTIKPLECTRVDHDTLHCREWRMLLLAGCPLAGAGQYSAGEEREIEWLKPESSFVPGLFPFIAVSPTSSQSSDIHTVGWVGDTVCCNWWSATDKRVYGSIKGSVQFS